MLLRRKTRQAPSAPRPAVQLSASGDSTKIGCFTGLFGRSRRTTPQLATSTVDELKISGKTSTTEKATAKEEASALPITVPEPLVKTSSCCAISVSTVSLPTSAALVPPEGHTTHTFTASTALPPSAVAPSLEAAAWVTEPELPASEPADPTPTDAEAVTETVAEPAPKPANAELATLLRLLDIDCGPRGLLAAEGKGLEVVTELARSVSDLICAAGTATAQLHNSATLAGFSHTLLLTLDSRLHMLADPVTALDALLVLVHEAATLVRADATPGWLLRTADSERTHDAYVDVHARLRAAAQEAGLCGHASYFRDVSKPLRRVLKQQGAGSLHAGIVSLLHSAVRREEVARLLGLTAEEVLTDARHCAETACAPATHLQQLRAAEGGAELEVQLHQVFSTFAMLGNRVAAARWTHEGTETELDSTRFLKLCQSSGLLGGSGPSAFTSTVADLLFTAASAKSPVHKRLLFDGFLAALALAAKHKGSTLMEVAAAVAAAGGPALRATTPEPVRLHDGVSARARSSLAGSIDEKLSLQVMLDLSERRPDSRALTPRPLGRSVSLDPSTSRALTPRGGDGSLTPQGTAPPPVAGLRLPLHLLHTNGAASPLASSRGRGPRSAAGSSTPRMPTVRSSRGKPSTATTPRAVLVQSHSLTPSAFLPTPSTELLGPGGVAAPPGAAPPASTAPSTGVYEPGLRAAFAAFAAFGEKQAAGASAAAEPLLSGAQWAKLVRETGMLGGGLDAVRADLVFCHETLGNKARKLNYAQFRLALELAAQARGWSFNEAVRTVAAAQGPLVNGAPRNVPAARSPLISSDSSLVMLADAAAAAERAAAGEAAAYMYLCAGC